jgi:hypothetical protein
MAAEQVIYQTAAARISLLAMQRGHRGSSATFEVNDGSTQRSSTICSNL